MELSNRQQNVEESWLNTDSNILIRAVAGSGKSTMLFHLLALCDKRTLMLSFNNSIQKEAEEKIEQRGLAQGKAMTLHALGLAALKPKYRFKIEKHKNFQLMKQVENANRNIFSNMKWEDKLRISYTLMDMNDVSRLFLTDDMVEIKKYMVMMDKSFFGSIHIEGLWEDFLTIREDSYNGNFIDIDFHDMIYLPVVQNLTIPVYPSYLMVDECQDLNVVQHKLIDKLISQGTIQRFIAVGDRNQSIYGFSGAYTSSFELFSQRPNTIELPLDICYRCPRKVIDMANEVYNVMFPFIEEEGIVREIGDPLDIKPNSLVICRNSEPLLDVYFTLIANGRIAHIKGEDILGSILRFLKPFTYKTLEKAEREMSKTMEKLAGLKERSDDDRFNFYKFKDNYKNFLLLAKNLAHMEGTVENLIKDFQLMFKNNDGKGISLCTIHKSKGLEADVVYILNEDLIPSKYAKSTQQLQQESNLKYVARTRAKKELYFLNVKL